MNNTSASPTPHGTTRREFLRTSASAVAAATVSGLDISRTAHAAGSDILRVGMIGAGGRNTGAGAQALRADKGARLVAISDIFMERVRAAREHIRNACPGQVEVPDENCLAGFDAYKRVIELSDVVCIANAAKFHPFHSMAAIRAGKHVFVEKPHGIDPAGVKLMQAA